jgi:hypothetical protein
MYLDVITRRKGLDEYNKIKALDPQRQKEAIDTMNLADAKALA